MTFALEVARATPPAADAIVAGVAPWLLLLAGACLLLACFGALVAAALLVYSPTKLELRARNGRGLELVKELERAEAGYQVVALCCTVGGLFGAFLSVQAGIDGSFEPWALGILGVAALLLGGVLPAAVAEARAEGVLQRCLPVLRFGLGLLRYPVVVPVRTLVRAMLRMLRIPAPSTSRPDEIAEEVMAAVSDSVTEGALHAEERLWIGNILELKDVQVSEAMTPRTDIVAVAARSTLRAAVALALEHGFSRYPVYEERIDEIVGVFYGKDALRLLATGPGALDPAAPVRSMMREPLFVPETMRAVQLLRRFKAERLQMAIVLDEYGGTAGLISIEDILEEIVGDIGDEYDSEEDESRVLEIEKGRVVEIPARTRVQVVNAMLGTDLREDDDYDTIAGYVISHLNRIPTAGETVRLSDVEIRILKADDRRLQRLRVSALEPLPAPEDG